MTQKKRWQYTLINIAEIRIFNIQQLQSFDLQYNATKTH